MSLVHLFYHVWCVNHWRDVVNEHVRILRDSGLSAHSTLHIGAIGSREDVSELGALTADLSPRLTYHGNDPDQFEFPTLEMLRDHCAIEHGAACYFHTKGVSQTEDPNGTYKRWLSVMNDEILRNWLRCLNALKGGYDVAGCKFKLGHEDLPYFAGNFWWASTEYVRHLPEISRESRYEAELWLFKGEPNAFDIPVQPL